MTLRTHFTEYSIALDGTETHVRALAIKDGKFVYVGDEAGVEEWVGDTTEVVGKLNSAGGAFYNYIPVLF